MHMPNKPSPKIEFRYYKMPAEAPFLALFGDSWKQNYGKGIDCLHFHNYLEIGYCFGGTGTLALGKEKYPYEKEMFAVIPQKSLHATSSDTVCSWEYLLIDTDTLLRQVCQGSLRRCGQLAARINSRAFLAYEAECPKIGQSIRNILDLMRQKKEFYLEEATAETAVLLLNIARENRGNAAAEKIPQKETAPVAQSLDYISMHYMEPLRIEDLAANCHLSESHFRKIFSACMGMGPIEYLNMVRIQAACDQLNRTDDFVTDIANKCGFATFSTFIRNFKKITGVSPNEWRKRPDHQNFI